MTTEAPETSTLSIAAPAADAAVRACVDQGMETLFGVFLDKLPVALTKMAEDAASAAEARGYQDMGRKLASDAGTWRKTFIEQVGIGLVGGDRDAVKGAAVSAEQIAMGKALVLAETKYFKAIAELEGRLNRLHVMSGTRAQGKALAPTGLHNALEKTAELMQWPDSCRRAIYSSFQQITFGQLDSVYAELLKGIKRIESDAAEAATGETAEAKPAPEKKAPRKPDQLFQTPDDTSSVDPQTAEMLRKFALNCEGDGYTDGLLAADLLALMDHRPLPGVQDDQSWVPLQRISLAGHFLNDVTADSLLSAAVGDDHETLRLPLVKSAIVDSSIFTAESHPLRSLIEELMLRSASLRLSEDPETRRLTELLEQVLEHFNLSADFVRESMANAQPLEDSQIERFFALQRKQAEQRRQFVINEARRMVGEEMERSTFGRDLPQRGLQFFDKLWGPLLTRRLLKYGAAHPRWKEGIEQADTLIDLIEARDPASPPSDEWKQLTMAMTRELIAAGMPQEQGRKVLALLESARQADSIFA